MITSRTRTAGVLALLLALHAGVASSAYNPAFCQTVRNTLNVHWEATAGPFTGCTGIEFTNGTRADARDGSITMAGIGVSNPACIGTAAYALTLSPDRTQLVGSDTISNVPMTLTRLPGQGCFVGTWALGADVYEAHISAAPFPGFSVGIPTFDFPELAALAVLLGLIGAMRLRRTTGVKRA
ncbi:MAG: hypothetical protein ABIQ72_07025 [Usitatibacter sp.]